MRLLVAAHKVLIAAAIVLAAILVAFGLTQGRLALAAAAAVSGAAAALYLRGVQRRYGRR